MRPLHIARRIARGVARRVRQPLLRRRSAVATAVALVVFAGLAASAHAATRTGTHDQVPSWLFSKVFRAIGQLFIALGDWFAGLGR